MREAVIVNAMRTAVGKAPRGSLKDTRPDDMAARVIKELMARTPEVKPEDVEDVVIGCATPEAQQGMNMARQAAAAHHRGDLQPDQRVVVLDVAAALHHVDPELELR